MSAVGLNFGSATSGQGFDVTSTINQIVANLQTVEVPWKSQLARFQSQDTALTALGTQLATLSADLQSLTDFNGTLASKVGSSSDTNVLSLSSANSTAVAGTHTITVQNLAQTSSAASDSIGPSDTLTGGITFRVGSGPWMTVNVGDNSTPATLSGLSAAINAAGLGVAASVLINADATERLSLVSQIPGAAGQIKLADTTSNPSSPTTLADSTTPDANKGIGLKTIQNGVDANITVDGVSLSSASNTVSNAIPGVTFQLLSTGASSSNLENVQVVIANDISGIETAIQTLVNDYNTTIKVINAQEGKDSSGNAEPLSGTSVLANLQQSLQSVVSATFGSKFINSLISLGISASKSADGTLVLDGSRLSEALNSKFSQVVSLFQDTGSFGSSFAIALDNLGNNAGAGGAIYLALREDASQEKALNDSISNEETLIATRKAALTAELNTANQILQSIPSLINQVDEMYSAITGYNSKNG